MKRGILVFNLLLLFLISSCEIESSPTKVPVRFDKIITIVEEATLEIVDNGGNFDVNIINTDSNVGGVQLDFAKGITITGASGGEAENAGFMITNTDDQVIAFSLSGASIPAGSYNLLNVEYTGGGNICFLDSTTVSNSDLVTFDLEVFDDCTGGIDWGCMDSNACNYDPAANYDDGTCIYGDGCTVYLTIENILTNSFDIYISNSVPITSYELNFNGFFGPGSLQITGVSGGLAEENDWFQETTYHTIMGYEYFEAELNPTDIPPGYDLLTTVTFNSGDASWDMDDCLNTYAPQQCLGFGGYSGSGYGVVTGVNGLEVPIITFTPKYDACPNVRCCGTDGCIDEFSDYQKANYLNEPYCEWESLDGVDSFCKIATANSVDSNHLYTSGLVPEGILELGDCRIGDPGMDGQLNFKDIHKQQECIRHGKCYDECLCIYDANADEIINALDVAVLEHCILAWSEPPADAQGQSPCNGNCYRDPICFAIGAACWGVTDPISPGLVAHSVLRRGLEGFSLGYDLFPYPNGDQILDVKDVIHTEGSRFSQN